MFEYKYVPVKSKEGKALTKGYDIPDHGLFPINEFEFELLKEMENEVFNFEWEDIPHEDPKGLVELNIAYCYGKDQVIMMSKTDFLNELNLP
jgi:hypothetical protein